MIFNLECGGTTPQVYLECADSSARLARQMRRRAAALQIEQQRRRAAALQIEQQRRHAAALYKNK